MNQQNTSSDIDIDRLSPVISAAIIAAVNGNDSARQQVSSMCHQLNDKGENYESTAKTFNEIMTSSFDEDSLHAIDKTGTELLSRVIDELKRIAPIKGAGSAPIYVGDLSDGSSHEIVNAETEVMLNDKLDAELIGSLFKPTKRIQILNVLKPVLADKIYESLVNEVPWSLRYLLKGTPREYTSEAYSRLSDLRKDRIQRNIPDMDFIVNQFNPLNDASLEILQEQYVYQAVLYLKSDHFIEFISNITGCDLIQRVDVRGACYSPGHFLKTHDDYNPGEHRLYAYVLNLSKDWDASWGGLLNFLDTNGNVAETLIPHFNSLSLFSTPTPHNVTSVESSAVGNQYSLTGWFYAKS